MLIHATGHTRTDVDIRPLIPAETEALARLRSSGLVQHSFIRTDHAGAFFILEADSIEDATRGMATLPFVEQGVMTVEYAEVVAPA